MTRGDVTVRGVNPKHLALVLDKLRSAGAEVDAGVRRFRIVQEGPAHGRQLRDPAVPGFPYRPAADGHRPGRGGGWHVDDHRERLRGAVPVRGGDGPAGRRRPDRWTSRGGPRESRSSRARRSGRSDIRAGAGLVLAGLCADGVTEVHDVYHIDRGYPSSWRSSRSSAETSKEWTRIPLLSGESGVTAADVSGRMPDRFRRTGSDQQSPNRRTP